MSLYVITSIDRPGTAALRQATRNAHLDFLKDSDLVRVHIAGPFLSNTGDMIGSMLIVETDEPARVAEFVANEPYGKAGLFASVDVRPWKVTVGSLG